MDVTINGFKNLKRKNANIIDKILGANKQLNA